MKSHQSLFKILSENQNSMDGWDGRTVNGQRGNSIPRQTQYAEILTYPVYDKMKKKKKRKRQWLSTGTIKTLILSKTPEGNGNKLKKLFSQFLSEKSSQEFEPSL